MPSKYDKNQYKRLSPLKDRRRKITPEKEKLIKMMFSEGYSLRAISRASGINRSGIDRIVRPDVYNKMMAAFKERRSDGRYKTTKEAWNATMREHRAYRRKVLQEEESK